MIVLNHVAMGARNVYVSADALRAQTGLGYYDGGFNEGGVGNKIFPLGGGAYLQLSGIVDAYAARENAGSKKRVEATRSGEVFESWNLRGTADDLNALAARHGLKAAMNAGGRIQANGELLRVMAMSMTPAGQPPVYAFPDFPEHPSAWLPDPAPGLRKPRGVSFLEVGGDLAGLVGWIGPEAAMALPLRFNGKAPGVYAVGVTTDTGEVVIRTPFPTVKS